MQKLVAVFSGVAVAVCLTATASAGDAALNPVALSQARTIKADLTARYTRQGGPKLRVSEASSTGVIESYLLLTAFEELRVVPADNGIFYAICPVRATCPYPGLHVARPPAAFTPRRLALELAVRTFRETSATLVAVSLPTEDFVVFIVERDELERVVDLATLARALGGNPARAPAVSLRRVVDEITRPRLYLTLGLEPTASGRDAIGAVPLWPDLTTSSRGAQSAVAGASPLELRIDGSQSGGSYEASDPFCPDGALTELEGGLSGGLLTELHRFTCRDGSGSIVARTWLLGVYEELSVETGAWQIVDGTGRYEHLRGKGSYVSLHDGSTLDRAVAPSVAESWWGVVAFDAVAPTLGVTRASARRLPGARREFLIRVSLSTHGDVRGEPVSYLVAANGRFLLAARSGTTSTGEVSIAMRIRPCATDRTIRLRVEAWDAVGNEASAVHMLRLPD